MNTRVNQIKRNIIMVIGAIVVVIILVYAYLEITTEGPAEQQLLKIKQNVQINMSGMEQSIDIFIPFP